jgi:hypothetical protein
MGGLDVFRFDDHVLDTERRELRRAADLGALNYLLFDLSCLGRNLGGVASKGDCLPRAVRLRTRIRLLQGLATPPN